MARQQKKSSGGNRKIGRAARKPKNARYAQRHSRERNKIKRMLRSNGYAYAREWAKAHSTLALFDGIAPKLEKGV